MKHKKSIIYRHIGPGNGSRLSVVLGLIVMMIVGASGAYLGHRSSAVGGGGPLIYVDTNPAGVANACWDVQLSWDNSSWADYGTRCTDSTGQYVMDSQYTYYRITATTTPSGYSFKSWCLPNNTCTSNGTIYFSSSAYANQHVYMYLNAPPPPPAPPTAPNARVTGSTTSSIGLAWTAGSPGTYGSISGYRVNRDGKTVNTLGGSTTSYVDGGLGCSQTHSYTVVLLTSGGASATSGTVSGTTAACPPAPTGASGGSAGPTSTSSSGSSGSGTRSGAVSNLQGGPIAGSISAQPPSVPADFKASLQSSKIVVLTWQPSTSSAGVQQYELSRSSDQKLWTSLNIAPDTSYTDTDTAFAHTYYYRVRAMDSTGAYSDYATTQITTGTFQATSLIVTSADKLVTARFTDAAFTQPADCTLGLSSQTLPTLNKEAVLTGPYALSCVGQDGSVIDHFAAPVAITMKLGDTVKGYSGITARQAAGGGGWSVLKGSYDAEARELRFNLSGTEAFASFGSPASSRLPLVIFLVFGLLVLGGLGWYLLRRLRGGKDDLALGPLPAAPVAATQLPPDDTSQQLFHTALSKPDCSHLNMVQQVQPQSAGCQECQAAGTHWKALRICLTCGHVGCSDDSYGHARAHFQQTGHPLMMAYADPNAGNIGWCYIDETYI